MLEIIPALQKKLCASMTKLGNYVVKAGFHGIFAPKHKTAHGTAQRTL